MHNAFMARTPKSMRLEQARKGAGHKTAAAGARALGMFHKYSTYAGHENGSRDFGTEEARKYASKFKVNAEWLLYNTGPKERTRRLDDDLADLTDEQRALIDGMLAVFRRERSQ